MDYAAAFIERAAQGEEVVLRESGLPVRLRPVSLTELVRGKVVPSSLFAAAMQGFPELAAAEAAAQKAAESGEGLDDATAERWARLALDVDNLNFQWVKASLVAPKLVDAITDKNQITYDMIPNGDREFIVQLQQLPVREWVRFLSGQAPRVQPVADVQGVLNPAE